MDFIHYFKNIKNTNKSIVITVCITLFSIFGQQCIPTLRQRFMFSVGSIITIILLNHTKIISDEHEVQKLPMLLFITAIPALTVIFYGFMYYIIYWPKSVNQSAISQFLFSNQEISLVYIFIVIIGPIFEEILFQGFIQTTFNKIFRSGLLQTILIPSIVTLLFVWFHIHNNIEWSNGVALQYALFLFPFAVFYQYRPNVLACSYTENPDRFISRA